MTPTINVGAEARERLRVLAAEASNAAFAERDAEPTPESQFEAEVAKALAEVKAALGTAAAGKQAGAGSNPLPRRFCPERETPMTERPSNRETENENLRPDGDGGRDLHVPRVLGGRRHPERQ